MSISSSTTKERWFVSSLLFRDSIVVLFSHESVIDPSSALGVRLGSFLGQSRSFSSIDISCPTESNGRISESSFARRTEKIETTKKGSVTLFVTQNISLWSLAPSTRLGTVQPEAFVRLGVSSRQRFAFQTSGDARDRSISEEQSNVGQENTGRLSLQSKEHRDLGRIHQVKTNVSIGQRIIGVAFLQDIQLRQYTYRRSAAHLSVGVPFTRRIAVDQRSSRTLRRALESSFFDEKETRPFSPVRLGMQCLSFRQQRRSLRSRLCVYHAECQS